MLVRSTWPRTAGRRGPRFFGPIGHFTWRRTVVTALITWLPLVLLAALEGNAFSSNMRESVLRDLRVTVRYLIAAPLFVAAGTVYLPQLAMAVRTFVDAELIARHDRARYDALVASTRRLVASPITDVLLTALAYVVTFTASPAFVADGATWAVSADGHFSYAGWWRMLVSQPIFMALWAVWLWRLALWTRFMWTVARMDLRLVAGHPDRVGGLRFVLTPIWGFAILAFAMGALGAGTVAESAVIDHRQLADFQYPGGGAHVLVSVVIFAGPLLLLSIPILRLQNQGTVRYGRLASRLGRQFERRWVDEGHRPGGRRGARGPRLLGHGRSVRDRRQHPEHQSAGAGVPARS